jgi:DivIVA domain-containing protein
MTEGRLAPEEVRTRTFSRVVRGYKRREVRRLLERAATDLARLRNGLGTSGPADQRPLTPEEVEEARFQPALGGYEMDEVDQFLDEVVAELEQAAHEPLRPSALPAPPRPGLFPPAHGFRPPDPAEVREEPVAQEARSVLAPDPDLDRGACPTAQPVAGPEPPMVVRPPRAAGPLPAAPPVGPDEGFFPPPSVPPSAAPASPPPPPPPPQAQRPPTLSPVRPLTPSEVETRSFDRGAPGYLPAHVDLFLAKAARALAGRDGDTLNRWDVLRQRFPLGPRGYATSEVDAFLVRLAAQFPEPDPAAQEEILRRLQERADGP